MIRIVFLVLLVFTPFCLFLNIGSYKIFVVLTELEAISRKSFHDEFIEFENNTDVVKTAQGVTHSDVDSDTSTNDVAKTVSDLTIESHSRAIIDKSTNNVDTTGPISVIESLSDKNIKSPTNRVEKSISDLDIILNPKQQQALATADKVEKRFEILLGCRKLPDILTIGFEKCGTDTLDLFLGIHPQIFQRGREGYYKLFNDDSKVSVHEYTKDRQCTPEGQLRLYKMSTRGTAANAHRVVPNAKLLAIVKEPVNRAMSHYVHRMENSMEDKRYTFDSVIASIMDKSMPTSVQGSVLFRQSSFLARLTPWMTEYGLNKIHIVDGDNFVKNPVQELQKVEEFLELRPYFTEDKLVFNEESGFYCIKLENDERCMLPNKGRQHPEMSEETRKRLENYFKPLNENFFNTVGRNFSWHY